MAHCANSREKFARNRGPYLGSSFRLERPLGDGGRWLRRRASMALGEGVACELGAGNLAPRGVHRKTRYIQSSPPRIGNIRASGLFRVKPRRALASGAWHREEHGCIHESHTHLRHDFTCPFRPLPRFSRCAPLNLMGGAWPLGARASPNATPRARRHGGVSGNALPAPPPTSTPQATLE